MAREFRHPDIDRVFIIEDAGPFEIAIDGIRIKRSDADWMVRTANHCSSSKDASIGDLSLLLLQHVMAKKSEKP